MPEEELRRLLSLPTARLLKDPSLALRTIKLLLQDGCSLLTEENYRRLPPRLRYLLFERIRENVLPAPPLPEKETWESLRARSSVPPYITYQPRFHTPCFRKLKEVSSKVNDLFITSLIEATESEGKRLSERFKNSR